MPDPDSVQPLKWRRFPTAIEQFNSGSLARAASMLELASDMIAKGEVDASIASTVRSGAHESLDFNRLRSYAEKAEKRHLLNRALLFFEGLSPRAVMEMLRLEPRRDRRRVFPSLLEAQGDAARTAALERLDVAARDPESAAQWYFPCNLICLLNRIPRADDSTIHSEITLAA
ncbi:MAG: hypothetical protein HXY20_01880 [Acidobacteria bacterium]|nr:hypothetical protein [Acidobacteriota bacterium]